MKYPDQKMLGMSGIVTGLLLTSSAACTGIAREMSHGLERQAYGTGMIGQLALAGLSFYLGDKMLTKHGSFEKAAQQIGQAANAEIIQSPSFIEQLEYEDLAEVIFLPTVDKEDEEDYILDIA